MFLGKGSLHYKIGNIDYSVANFNGEYCWFEGSIEYNNMLHLKARGLVEDVIQVTKRPKHVVDLVADYSGLAGVVYHNIDNPSVSIQIGVW